MEKGLITIVVPVYKVEKYLDRCIESIVNQTYSNLEIILVDDGSPDKCGEMCDGWATRDSRIKVIHKKNEGLGMARNTGIDNASGEYVCFFDSDDYVDNNTIEIAYRLANEKNLDIVTFGLRMISKDGSVTKEIIPSTDKLIYYDLDIQSLVLPTMLLYDCDLVKKWNLWMSACNCLISTEMINVNSWRFVSERDIISEDVYSLLNLYRHVKRLGVISEAFYNYCENQNSLSRVFKEERFKRIRDFYEKTYKLIISLNYDESVQDALKTMFFSYVIGTMKGIVDSDLSRRRKKELLDEILLDQRFQNVIINLNLVNESKKRRCLRFFIMKKMQSVVYILVKARTKI